MCWQFPVLKSVVALILRCLFLQVTTKQNGGVIYESEFEAVIKKSFKCVLKRYKWMNVCERECVYVSVCVRASVRACVYMCVYTL